MAKTDDAVMQMVEQELAKDPDVSVEDLFEKAKGINAGVSRLTRRQFHARYPLQVKRRKGGGARKGRKAGRKRAAAKAPGRAGAGRRAAAADGNREAVRQVFLRFAQDLAGAEGKDLVKVMISVDRYVDDAIKASARK